MSTSLIQITLRFLHTGSHQYQAKLSYCTKWQLQIVKEYIVTALILESEIKSGKDYYFEGIAIISGADDPSNKPISYAFVKQMGFTH